jgi:Domain of unknown function (DUF927)/Cch helix turn helix domain/Toprim domain
MQFSSMDFPARVLSLTPSSNGWWTGRCPHPDHEDLHPSFIARLDVETGQFITYCHVCEDQTAVRHAAEEKLDGAPCDGDCSDSGEVSTIRAFPAPEAKVAYNRQKALEIWEDADAGEEIAGKYLQGRGLSGTLPDSVRQTTLEYGVGSGTVYPVMIAKIVDVNGDFAGIHRTYLAENADGSVVKAPVAAPKKVLGSVKGHHLGLGGAVADVLHLAEGLETAIAIQEALDAPVWCCISAHNLLSIVLPDSVRMVYVWADRDRSGTGGRYANSLAQRLHGQGIDVCVLLPEAEIAEGQKSVDWLDVGMEGIVAAFSKVTAPKASALTPATPWGHLKMPEEYSIDYSGVYREKVSAKGEITQILVATGPIWPSGRRIELSTGETEIELSWHDQHKKLHSRWLSRGHVLRSATILDMAELSSFPVFDGINRETVRFLALLENNNSIVTELVARRPGWNIDPSNKPTFVLDCDDANFRLHSEAAYQPYVAALSVKGDFTEWLRVVTPMVIRFPMLLFALVAVLAAPLLRILRVPNFIIDFWGKTSCGKTSLLVVIASVWGKPTGSSSLILSWNNTQIFAERIASFFGQGLPLFLDDSQTANEKTIEAITYMVANGTGRGRAKPYSIRETDRFETVMFTTGEKPLTEKSYPGAKARTIGIHGSPFPGVDPVALATLKTVITLNHGHLARRFVTSLVAIPADDLVACHDLWMEHFTNLSTNEIGNRYAAYFSAIRVAAHVLLQDPGMDWMRPHLLPALYEVWDLATAEVSENDMAQKALHGIAGWIESNKRHFAVVGCQTELQPTFGTIRRDEGFIAVLPHVFRQALRDIGIQSEAAALAEWKRQGFLLHHPTRNQRQVKVEGKPVWCICIKTDALFPNTDAEEAAVIPMLIDPNAAQNQLPN